MCHSGALFGDTGVRSLESGVIIARDAKAHNSMKSCYRSPDILSL